MSDNTQAGGFVYPDGSTPPIDPDTGLPVLEDRTADFPDEAAEAVEVEGEYVTSTGRRLGATSGMSAFRGLMAKRAERRAAREAEEPTEPVAPDTDEERQAALALAAEKGLTEDDLVDDDGNPLDVAGIHARVAAEEPPAGDDGAQGDDAGGDAGSTPDAAAVAADEGAEGDDESDEDTEDASGTEEPPAEEEPEAPADEGFDPSAHTVTEVQAYLDEHPDQATYVLDRERTGKARVTLIGA